MKRVLFVGGGRRVSLARRFKKHGFDVVGYEIDPNCPLMEEGYVYKGRSWNDPEIEDDLLNLMLTDNISIAIPLMDAATVVLSKIKGQAANQGTHIPTSSVKANEICLNKKKFENKFGKRDFYPSVQNQNNGQVIAKPVRGFAARNIKTMEWRTYHQLIDLNDRTSNQEGIDLKEQLQQDEIIVQRYIANGKEISVDAYFNKAGKMIDAVPRQRLEIQGGEIVKGITLSRDKDYGTIELTRLIGEEIGLIGPICAQYVVDPKDQKAYVMEINARIGGGLPLSLEAGFDIIDMMKREYLENEELKPQQIPWKEGLGMCRYFLETFYAQ
jgi:carbamoyl-phosphate synthase large subunit